MEDGAAATGEVRACGLQGRAQSSTDLITARVDFGSFAAGSVLPLVNAAKSKHCRDPAESLGAGAERPTTVEQGLPDWMPACSSCCSQRRQRRVHGGAPARNLRKIVGDPALAERFAKIGFDPTPTSSEDMVAVMRKNGDDWAGVIKRLNIRLD